MQNTQKGNSVELPGADTLDTCTPTQVWAPTLSQGGGGGGDLASAGRQKQQVAEGDSLNGMTHRTWGEHNCSGIYAPTFSLWASLDHSGFCAWCLVGVGAL